MNKYKTIVKNAEKDLLCKSLNEMNIIQAAKAKRLILSNTLQKLKAEILNRGFESKEDEIHFFKHIKPPLYAQLIHQSLIIEIEAKRNHLSPEDQKAFLEEKMKPIRNSINENQDFNLYILSNESYHDELYFTRDQQQLTEIGATFPLWFDPDFTTAKDIVLAQILSLELITNYFSDDQSKMRIDSPLIWTESKNAIVELIYALHATDSFNNGEVSISEISNIFEIAFNFKIGDYYRIFHELRSRKTGRTKFIGQMQNNLQLKMDLLDQ